jgi:hypothetical protein
MAGKVYGFVSRLGRRAAVALRNPAPSPRTWPFCLAELAGLDPADGAVATATVWSDGDPLPVTLAADQAVPVTLPAFGILLATAAQAGAPASAVV